MERIDHIGVFRIFTSITLALPMLTLEDGCLRQASGILCRGLCVNKGPNLGQVKSTEGKCLKAVFNQWVAVG